MKSKVYEFLVLLSIIFLFILMITSSIRLTYGDLSLKLYSTCLEISGLLAFLIYIFGKIKNFKFNKFEIIIFIMMLLSCLSLINAIDINTAIFGKAKRFEGLLVILTYDVFLLNAISIKNKKYIKIIISLIIVYSFVNIFYGLYQTKFFPWSSIFEIKKIWHYACGFLGNSMYYGTLTAVFYGIIFGIFIKCNVGLKKYFLAILLLISTIGFIISGAMSSFVGLFVIYLVSLIQIIISLIKKKKNSLVHLVSFFIAVGVFVLIFFLYSNNFPHVKNDLLEMIGQTKSVSQGKIDETYGTGRIYIWKNTIEKIKEAPITGYGIDNFRLVFDNKLIDQISNTIVDKAHNEYLQKMLCEGVIAGVLFIVFLIYVFYKCIRRELSPIYYGLFMGFTIYSVQAFFNISVTRVAPVYFIITGLLIGGLYEKTKYSNSSI